MKRYVHRNLHRQVWSLTRGGNPPTTHHVALLLHFVELRVRPGGRERARREGRKNVHAFLVADASRVWPGVHEVAEGVLAAIERYGPPIRLTYTPFKSLPHFTTHPDYHDLFPVGRARVALCDRTGALWGWGLETPDGEAI